MGQILAGHVPSVIAGVVALVLVGYLHVRQNSLAKEIRDGLLLIASEAQRDRDRVERRLEAKLEEDLKGVQTQGNCELIQGKLLAEARLDGEKVRGLTKSLDELKGMLRRIEASVQERQTETAVLQTSLDGVQRELDDIRAIVEGLRRA